MSLDVDTHVFFHYNRVINAFRLTATVAIAKIQCQSLLKTEMVLFNSNCGNSFSGTSPLGV